MEKTASTPDIILDTALELAEETSWENVRLYHIAQRAGLSLNHIRQYFREKEALVDAWLDRADQAMLDETNHPSFPTLPPRERLNRLFIAWLETLSPHRSVMRQMVFNRLEPGHFHMQLASLLRISRTVQWVREAAQREQTFLFRALDETALTSTYLAAFLCWLNDSTQNYQRTRRLLDRILYLGETMESFRRSFLRPHRQEQDFTPASPQEAP